MSKSKVYFTKNISPESIIRLYDVLGVNLKGNVGAKLHSGEDGNQNYVRPEFVRPIIEKLNATVIETNTAYDGARNNTKKHLELIKKHGWDKYFKVDILDAYGEDLKIKVDNYKVLKENLIGKNTTNYDSIIVLSHFKGHPMGGYGGALKQLSIGFASSAGKARIHSAGLSDDMVECWKANNSHDSFLESMADAAYSVDKMFKNNIVYVNMMVNMSVDCDCCAKAEDPCMKDIGILISTDPVAIDMACIDLVKNSDDIGKNHLLERINSRNGTHTIDVAYELGIGLKDYELINID